MAFQISREIDYFVKLAIHLREKKKSCKKIYTKDLNVKKKTIKELVNDTHVEYLLYTRHYSKSLYVLNH